MPQWVERWNAELLAELLAKGERLLEMDRVRFEGLLELLDASLLEAGARRKLPWLDGRVGEVN